MKQINIFGEEFENKQESDYTSKIKIPIYEPKNFINEVNASGVDEDEKRFLIEAAKRQDERHKKY